PRARGRPHGARLPDARGAPRGREAVAALLGPSGLPRCAAPRLLVRRRPARVRGARPLRGRLPRPRGSAVRPGDLAEGEGSRSRPGAGFLTPTGACARVDRPAMTDPRDEVVATLRRKLGAEAVLDDRSEMLVYESDGSAMRRALPSAVVFPRGTDDVVEVVSE